jgi:hypothetical protein
MDPEETEMESQSDLEVTAADAVKEAVANPWLLTITVFDTAALLPWGDWNWRDEGSTVMPPVASGASIVPEPVAL